VASTPDLPAAPSHRPVLAAVPQRRPIRAVPTERPAQRPPVGGHAGSARTRRRAMLGRFLPTHRKRRAPAETGLPVGPRWRTSGLRHEEVGMLAQGSPTHSGYLEQRRDLGKVMSGWVRPSMTGPAPCLVCVRGKAAGGREVGVRRVPVVRGCIVGSDSGARSDPPRLDQMDEPAVQRHDREWPGAASNGPPTLRPSVTAGRVDPGGRGSVRAASAGGAVRGQRRV
jgi:hypothetical protein